MSTFAKISKGSTSSGLYQQAQMDEKGPISFPDSFLPSILLSSLANVLVNTVHAKEEGKGGTSAKTRGLVGV